MTPDEFWLAFNLELFTKLVLMGMASFAIGYAVGYKLYLFRRIAQSST